MVWSMFCVRVCTLWNDIYPTHTYFSCWFVRIALRAHFLSIELTLLFLTLSSSQITIFYCLFWKLKAHCTQWLPQYFLSDHSTLVLSCFLRQSILLKNFSWCTVVHTGVHCDNFMWTVHKDLIMVRFSSLKHLTFLSVGSVQTPLSSYNFSNCLFICFSLRQDLSM